MLFKKLMNSFNATSPNNFNTASANNQYMGKTLQTKKDSDRAITSLTQLGNVVSTYSPTYVIDEPFINDYHRSLSTAALGRLGIPVCIDLGIDGYLQRDDALKIYELAYFAAGDILELGTHKGLSTSIIVNALQASGNGKKLTTVDIDTSAVNIAKNNIANIHGSNFVSFNISDATKFMNRKIQEGKKYSFVFIDHWHGYEATYEAATRLPNILEKGGFALFHDYNDVDNANPKHTHKVYQAVADTLVKDASFEFITISGCCALFRKIA